jgi:hypothetical protein
MALNTEVAGTGSDSYVNLTGATTYITNFVRYKADWDSQGTATKEMLLRRAAQDIDHAYTYRGNQYYDYDKGDDYYQNLIFPRDYMQTNTGHPYIPDEISNAQVEQAIYILTRKVNNAPELEEGQKAKIIGPEAKRLIKRHVNNQVKKVQSWR